ncbi:MAG: hypothetical protein JWQ01_1260 [Massilia sp.]|nr:hypothetical protein [Massilia sp.]
MKAVPVHERKVPMRLSLVVLLCSLVCAVIPASAQTDGSATNTPSAKPADLLEWHDQLVAQYKQLHYLDADGKPMTAAAFLEIVERRSAGFTMTRTQTGAEQPSMTLQILAPGAAR